VLTAPSGRPDERQVRARPPGPPRPPSPDTTAAGGRCRRPLTVLPVLPPTATASTAPSSTPAGLRHVRLRRRAQLRRAPLDRPCGRLRPNPGLAVAARRWDLHGRGRRRGPGRATHPTPQDPPGLSDLPSPSCSRKVEGSNPARRSTLPGRWVRLAAIGGDGATVRFRWSGPGPPPGRLPGAGVRRAGCPAFAPRCVGAAGPATRDGPAPVASTAGRTAQGAVP
jgi:hypothetical protein